MNPTAIYIEESLLPGVVSIETDVPAPYTEMVVYRYETAVGSGAVPPWYSGENPATSIVGVPVRRPSWYGTWSATMNVVSTVDSEAPMGVVCWYRVAYKKADGTFTDYSQWYSITTTKHDGWWLSNPIADASPSYFGWGSIRQITPELGDIDLTYPRAMGVFTPLRGSRDTVYLGPVRGLEAEVPIIIRGADEWTAMRTMLMSGTPLLLRHPELGTVYTAMGDVQVTRMSDVGADPLRVVRLSIHQVGRPA